MEFRTIRREEASEHIRLMQYAFGGYTTEEIKEEAVENVPIDTILAAFDSTTLASGITVHPFKHSIRGASVSMAGIGGVATRPEYRGKGLVRKLLRKGFERMRASGQAVSMLRPFRERFYEQFGYVRSNGAIDYRISCRSFAQFAGKQGEIEACDIRDPTTRVRYFEALQKRFSDVHGRVLFEELDDKRFAKRFANRVALFATRAGEVEAIATYTKEGFLSEGKLEVADFLWRDADAREQLFAYFALHRDQISTITITLPYDTNIHAMIPGIEDRVEATYRGAPWMVRIIEPMQAFNGIPARGEFEIVVGVSDPICESNNGAIRLEARDGTIAASATKAKADVDLTIEAASSLLYGTLSPELFYREHQPDIHNEPAWDALMQALPPRTLFNDYWF
ncbi:MAG: GNAT family N-acetyltransferase [Spirochaetota bacterium]